MTMRAVNQEAKSYPSAAAQQQAHKPGCCPCCGEPRTFAKPLVSLEFNSLSFRDQTIYLTPTIAEIAFVLCERMPGVVTRCVMFERVWGGLSDVHPKIIDVSLSKLRQQTALLGLKIETIRSTGWRLVITERAAEPQTSASSESALAITRVGADSHLSRGAQ